MRLEKKLIVIGEQRVGKTRLLELLSKGYTRHRFKNSASFFATERTFAVELDLAIIEFSMWDSQGKEDYEHLRPLLYPGTDVVLLVFDTTNRYSLNLIDKKWVSDVWHYMQGAQYILVGNKSDERDARENLMTADQSLVSHKQGEAMAKRIGAKAYVECSLSNRNSMCRVLEVAARYCVQAEGQKKEKGTGWISRLRRK
ncbi:transforming protein RhoA [Thozetella sp. PMI_491]|nr:transforming protein RhoA [Thozetella sp. PMI_491]